MRKLADGGDTPLPCTYFENKYDVGRVTLWRYRRAGLPSLQVGVKSFVWEGDFIAFLEGRHGQSFVTPKDSTVGGV